MDVFQNNGLNSIERKTYAKNTESKKKTSM